MSPDLIHILHVALMGTVDEMGVGVRKKEKLIMILCVFQ